MSMRPVPVTKVRIDDTFWASRQEIARTQGIPYQLEALNDRLPDTEPSYCIRNLRMAAGVEERKEHRGFVFQDSDVAKWLEAVAFSLMWHPDPRLEQEADEVIGLICAAQLPDGYLSTYYILGDLSKRWTNLADNHELYIAGHMIEAAVAYYQATGKRALLDACLRLVDHIDSVLGPEEGKKHGYPGHPVIEMALIRLYEITKDEKHLRLAKYFIDQRGQQPLYFAEERERYGNSWYWKNSVMQYQYYQAGKPVREQTEAEGHSVRAAYLYSGMEDVARETNDEGLHEACERLWRSITTRRMYITGAIGSSEYGEAFTYDYDLPGDAAYAETCASIAMMFLAQRMLRTAAKSEYADVMERALYNSVISGMDLDGRRFFYVNPLEVVPEACEKDQRLQHVKPVRQKWFGCSCCPPNLMRLLTSLGQYIYSTSDDTAYVHLYIGSEAKLTLGGREVALHMHTDYPWNGGVRLDVHPAQPGAFRLALRVPGWCRSYALKVNGTAIDAPVVDGYACIDREWADNDAVELTMEMPVEIVRANPRVREDAGKAYVTRGPIVYCLEGVDNGDNLHLIRLNPNAQFEVEYRPDLLAGVTVLRCPAVREQLWDSDALYAPYAEPALTPVTLTFIPYYAWANRGLTPMTSKLSLDSAAAAHV